MKRLLWVFITLVIVTGCENIERHNSLEDAIEADSRVQEDGYHELMRFKVPDGVVLLYEIDRENYYSFGYSLFGHDISRGWYGSASGEMLALPSKPWLYVIRDSRDNDRGYSAVYGRTLVESVSEVHIVFDDQVTEQTGVENGLFLVVAEGSTIVCEMTGLDDVGNEVIKEVVSEDNLCK